MPDYRLCLIGEGGAARTIAEFAAPDDQVALRMSEDAAAGQAAELYRGDLLVGRLLAIQSEPHSQPQLD